MTIWKRRFRFGSSLLPLLLGVWLGPIAAEQPRAAMHLEIDARDLPRSLLQATVTVSLEPQDQDHEVALWYPKWVPGSHGPGGAVANLAGLKVLAEQGQPLTWRRTPGEVYRIVVRVPAQTNQLTVNLRYIANQPTTNSMGHDSFGSPTVGIISPSTVLLYREGDAIDHTMITTGLRLPAGWQAATALQAAQDSQAAHGPQDSPVPQAAVYQYAATSLRNLVDSPIMCGQHYQAYAWDFTGQDVAIAPHVLHVFSEDATAVQLDPQILGCLQNMVIQTARLTGSQPFDQFDILLALTDHLPSNGLEHSRSTLNVLPPRSMQSLSALKGWSRLLIPHEYLHTWCGKYRRPAEMATTDFHTPQGTDLLWVYEGLTQYLGEVIEARCGLMEVSEFRDRIAVELRNAAHQQNRRWRPLLDTAAASHVLRDRSAAWPKLRGSQDYYMEGMLFWLEADAIIRNATDQQRSLDDFCKLFFAVAKPTATATHCPPKPHDRDEIVRLLGRVVRYDWDGLIKRRVESMWDHHDPQVADLLGYTFGFSDRRPSIPAATFRLPSGSDHYDSLGMLVASDGKITDVQLDSPADRAKLSPGMRIVGIDQHQWNGERLERAVQASANSPPIQLLVADGEQLKTVHLQYSGGQRYLTLASAPGRTDLLPLILASQ